MTKLRQRSVCPEGAAGFPGGPGPTWPRARSLYCVAVPGGCVICSPWDWAAWVPPPPCPLALRAGCGEGLGSWGLPQTWKTGGGGGGEEVHKAERAPRSAKRVLCWRALGLPVSLCPPPPPLPSPGSVSRVRVSVIIPLPAHPSPYPHRPLMTTEGVALREEFWSQLCSGLAPPRWAARAWEPGGGAPADRFGPDEASPSDPPSGNGRNGPSPEARGGLGAGDKGKPGSRPRERGD